MIHEGYIDRLHLHFDIKVSFLLETDMSKHVKQDIPSTRYRTLN